ncbi:MAG: flavin reductase family protein [Eubacterium sp.]|nr:flavin reductase family protein [Eubacterium sp.]
MAKQYWKPGNMLYPVPAVMATCQRAGEKPNIITIAWTGTVCSDPAMVSISVRRERYSYAIIKESGEFVINLTTKRLVKAADYCGVRSGRDVDKFADTGLTPCASKSVGCPGIAESPVNIECRVSQILNLGSHDLFLATVENVGVEESLLDETGRLQLNSSGLAVYSHGGYFALGSQLGSFGYSVRKNLKNPKKPKNKKKTNAHRVRKK